MSGPAAGGSLSVRQGAALTLAAVLGPGVISLPALAIDAAGPASLVAWAALLVVSVPLAATFAALGTRHPDGGGVATYARLAFGERASTMVGWAFFLAITGSMPRWLGGDIGDGRRTPRRALAVVAGLGLVVTGAEAALGQPTDATLLVTTGTFALVYVVGTAAAVRLLPGGWPRLAAVVSFAASVALVVLTGLPVLIPLATGLAGLLWTSRRRGSSRPPAQRRNRSHTRAAT